MLYINVKELLKEKKRTKYWLIKEMGCSYQAISDVMNNNTKGMKFETLEKLCEVLECTPNDIFRIEKNDTEKKDTV